MELFEKIKHYFDALDESTFYKIIIGVVIGIIVLFTFGIVRYYWKISSLTNQIRQINIERYEVKDILDQKEAVMQQKKEVDSILEEDPDFRIAGFFKKLLAKLTMSATISKPEEVEKGDKYTENSINLQFTNIKMKQLAQLLYEAEQKPRVYTKSLEITRSKKTPKTINVTITFATLVKKKPE